MKQQLVTLAILPTLLGWGGSTESDHMNGRPLIGTVSQDETTTLKKLCECEFYRGPIDGTTTVFATWEHRQHALARIAGELTHLEFRHANGAASCRSRAKLTQHWKGKRTTVVLDLRVDKPGEEACWYSGTMRVTAGGRKATIAITGACGC